MSWVEALFSVAEQVMGKYYFDESKRTDQKLSEISIDNERKLHKETIEMTQNLMKHESRINLEMHFQQLVTDLGGSHR